MRNDIFNQIVNGFLIFVFIMSDFISIYVVGNGTNVNKVVVIGLETGPK